jgi:hypothetical protein
MHPLLAQALIAHHADPATFRPHPDIPNALRGSVPRADAETLWLALRAAFPTAGLWPVLRGKSAAAIDTEPVDLDTALAAIPAGSVRDLLTERFAQRVAFFRNMTPLTDHPAFAHLAAHFPRPDGAFRRLADLPETPDWSTFIAAVDNSGAMSFGGKVEPPAPWPAELPSRPFHLTSTRNSSDSRPFDPVDLDLLPLAHPWEAPVYLSFGNWNECPAPELQAAVLREWHASHGAVPAAITGDVLECFVERPPQTQAAAMDLAAEQWIFCDDIVSQGTQTVRNLALERLNAPHWFFWWD